jgi:dTDP-4-amino-4,6-dideoxygalactose transaminase
MPIPKQPAFAAAAPAGCPVASQVCHEILSLPLHPAMHDGDVDAIADAVNAFDS